MFTAGGKSKYRLVDDRKDFIDFVSFIASSAGYEVASTVNPHLYKHRLVHPLIVSRVRKFLEDPGNRGNIEAIKSFAAVLES